MPTEAIVETMCDQVMAVVGNEREIAAVGVGVPGLVRNGVIEEAPNLPQLKGARLAEMLAAQLRDRGIEAPVSIINDADGFAAGIAASLGKLDTVIRVWTLGVGIGYGRYPADRGRVGGRPHGGDAGRQGELLRVRRTRPSGRHHGPSRDAAALPGYGAGRGVRGGEGRRPRCLEFKKLWHKALAAATATSIHLRGPGKFFLAGFNVRFVDMPMLKDYLVSRW
jgi:glucokinase